MKNLFLSIKTAEFVIYNRHIFGLWSSLKAAFAAIFAAVDVREDYAKIASTSRGTISGARVFLLHDEKAIKQFFYILISVTRTEEILYCLQESCAKIISEIIRR